MQLRFNPHADALQHYNHSGRRLSCCRAVHKSRSSDTVATPTTAALQTQNGASRVAAALTASVIAVSAFAPVAWADEECKGVFCSDSQGSAVAAAKEFKTGQSSKLQAADESFKNSDTLKALLEKSEANKAKNKKAIQNKYCYRQAELGIGDCGGLRYIPGMTKNGKQETPEWMQKMLGVEVPKVEGQGKTLADLLGPDVEP